MKQIKSTFFILTIVVISALLHGCVPFDENSNPCEECAKLQREQQQQQQYVPPNVPIYNPPSNPIVNPPANTGGNLDLVVQIGAFINRHYADKFTVEARNRLGQAVDQKPNKVNILQIVSGFFRTQAEAQNYLNFVREKGYKDAFIKETKYLY
ncbi:hypothetical protein BH10BAC5_BH10BAC5_18290 [soil metagenome]